jgi:GxxExxY protein
MSENERLNTLTEAIIGAAIEVHKELGPGLLESTYEACLMYELVQRGFKVERQKELPVVYKGVHIACGYRLDLFVEESVILELKSVEKLERIHEAQVISYLKLSGKHVALLINFNVLQLVKGLNRLVRDFPE